jgi:hypothetical protein
MTNFGALTGFTVFCPNDVSAKDRRRLKAMNFFILWVFVLPTKLGF